MSKICTDFKQFMLSFSLLVRCRWCFQGWIKRIPQAGTCWRWIQWCWSSSYSIENWNYYPRNKNSKRFGWERTKNPWIDICCPKKIQLPRWQCWGSSKFGTLQTVAHKTCISTLHIGYLVSLSLQNNTMLTFSWQNIDKRYKVILSMWISSH